PCPSCRTGSAALFPAAIAAVRRPVEAAGRRQGRRCRQIPSRAYSSARDGVAWLSPFLRPESALSAIPCAAQRPPCILARAAGVRRSACEDNHRRGGLVSRRARGAIGPLGHDVRPNIAPTPSSHRAPSLPILRGDFDLMSALLKMLRAGLI